MKAIRVHQFGGPDVLKLEDVPVPEPAGDQVLVRVHAVGVNPVDTYIRSGRFVSSPGVNSGRPYTPGRDAAGVVERVGADLRRIKAGARVYASNTSTGAYDRKGISVERSGAGAGSRARSRRLRQDSPDPLTSPPGGRILAGSAPVVGAR